MEEPPEALPLSTLAKDIVDIVSVFFKYVFWSIRVDRSHLLIALSSQSLTRS